MNLRKGSKVWVEDKDLAWVAAEVVSDSVGRHVQVLTATGKKVIIDFSYGSVVCFETMSFGFFILFFEVWRCFFLSFQLFCRFWLRRRGCSSELRTTTRSMEELMI